MQKKEIATKGILSENHAIPLILKTLFNHVTHLDTEITELRKSIDFRFEQMGKRITHLFTTLTFGFTIIAFLIILFGFIK